MAKLEDLRTGDWVRWSSTDWEVTDRSVYRESSDYSEVQWELEGGGGTRYLVMSRENKGSSVEEIWVCTRQVGIGRVQRQLTSGGWQGFREKDSMAAAPARVRFDGLEFTLEGETQGKAEDDEGDTVNKLTWDYYDPARKRNLAIEVWQCSDADYYEAYDGLVVRPADIVPIPPKVRRGFKLKDEAVANLVIAVFSCVFFLPIVAGAMGAFDTGAEYLAALLVPAFAFFVSGLAGAHRGMLGAAAALGVGGAIALLNLRGLGASYWEYSLYGLAAGVAAAEVPARMFGGLRSSDKAFSAGCASLLLLYIVSFAHYVKFAPRPHDSGLLLAACVLPLPAAVLAFAGYFLRGRTDEPA